MELQDRQGDFKARGAALFVLGSQPEPVDVARAKATSHSITYPIMYDANTSVTRKVGLWSDQMEMPFMGYIVIDMSGRIVAGEQALSEAKGAAPANIERILSALEKPRQGAAGGRGSGG